jgi:arylsulfatase A-like enzyme
MSDSRNQLPAWLGLDNEGREYLIGAATSLMIRTKDWKYIEPNNGNAYQKLTNIEMGNSPEDQLYHLRYDRGEYDNVAEKNQLKVRFFKQILEEEKSKGVGLDL